MNIVPIDSTGRLFQVENILPAELTQEILEQEWDSCPWTTLWAQENKPRRLIDNTALTLRTSEYIWTVLDTIEKFCNVRFHNRYPSTVWYYDTPGYDIEIHTDGTLPATMQLYWITPADSYGTVFYNSKQYTDVHKAFKSVPNTGYIMFNLPDKNGHQPSLWHAMTNTVPPGKCRLTSYTLFGPYENK